VKRSLIVLLLIAGSVLVLDYWTKQWASRSLAGRPPVNLVGEVVRFTYTRNSGVAFGLGAGVRFPYYLFSIVAAIVILYLFLRQRVPSLPRQMALSLILGGALGNLVDRLRSGEVVDFIEIGWRRWHWPVFNVADAAVTVGVVLFALVWRRSEEEPVPSHAAEALPGESRPAPPARAADLDETNAGSLGARVGHGGAAGPLPRGSADRPLP
jgi:signal peptidase II